MAAGNTVTLTGNLTRDPELRFTPSGQATTSFSIAVNRRWQNRQTQEWEESTSFVDVVCWAQLAENVAQTFSKGDRALIDGRLDQRSWETNEGDKRSRVEITADDVAPSLRWATATIARNQRSDRNHTQPGQPAAPAQPQQQPGNYDYQAGEEPF